MQRARRLQLVSEIMGQSQGKVTCEELTTILREEHNIDVSSNTVYLDLATLKKSSADIAEKSSVQWREALVLELINLKSEIYARGIEHRDYVHDLVICINKIAKLTGAFSPIEISGPNGSPLSNTLIVQFVSTDAEGKANEQAEPSISRIIEGELVTPDGEGEPHE